VQRLFGRADLPEALAERLRQPGLHLGGDVAPDRLEEPVEGGARIGGRAPLGVERPALGDRPSLLLVDLDLAARGVAERGVENDRQLLARRDGNRERVDGTVPSGPAPA
jgi:hypothetical protein